MNSDAAIYKKMASLSLKSGSVNGGDCTRQVILSKKYPTKLSFQTTPIRSNQKRNIF